MWLTHRVKQQHWISNSRNLSSRPKLIESRPIWLRDQNTYSILIFGRVEFYKNSDQIQFFEQEFWCCTFMHHINEEMAPQSSSMCSLDLTDYWPKTYVVFELFVFRSHLDSYTQHKRWHNGIYLNSSALNTFIQHDWHVNEWTTSQYQHFIMAVEYCFWRTKLIRQKKVLVNVMFSNKKKSIQTKSLAISLFYA